MFPRLQIPPAPSVPLSRFASRSGVRAIVTLTAIVLSTSPARAGSLTLGPQTTLTLGSASAVDLHCNDLSLTPGALVTISGGTLDGVFDVFVASNAVLDASNGTLALGGTVSGAGSVLGVPIDAEECLAEPTVTASPSWTPTATASELPTHTATEAPPPTPTPTATGTPSTTATYTASQTPAATSTPVATATWTASASATPSPTGTPTATTTPTFTATATSTPTPSATATSTVSPTSAPTHSATATLSPTPVDADGDGVDDVVEAGCGPDANGDGIDDAQQGDVASLPSAGGGRPCLTVIVAGGCSVLQAVRATTPSDYGGDRREYVYPLGMVGFDLPCEQATVSLLLPGFRPQGDAMLRKFGPLSPGDPSTARFFTLEGAVFDAVEVDGVPVSRVTYTLSDGELGDATGEDGLLRDPAGPAFSAATAPTAGNTGRILLLVALLALAVRTLLPARTPR